MSVHSELERSASQGASPKLSPKALERTERELADFFDNASIGLHSVGRDGRILRVNEAELALLGYSRDEYLGHHIAEFHVDRPVIEDILARLSRGETLRDYPARMRAKDGSIRDVLINSSVLFEGGQFIHSRCLTIDVTDRKRAEDARALLASIVTASEDSIVSTALDGVILFWNRGAERLFGYSAEEAIGQPITFLIPSERQGEERSIVEQLRRGERIASFESVRVAKDGRTIDVSVTVSPVRDHVGAIVGTSRIVRDITGRKRTEEALRESEERFRMLADNMSQLAWMADEKGWIFWYNRRWYDYTGTTLDDMQGWGWTKVHHADHVDRVVASIRESWTTGKPWEETFPLRGKDGEYRWFLSRAVPIRDREGRVTRWFGTNTDVTAQRALEEALREADRRKNDFLATLGHELRNPLAPIRTAAGILRTRALMDPMVIRCRDVIDRQVTQMARLLDDLLDVARLSRGKLTLQRSRVLLDTVLDAAIETSLPLLEQRRQTLSVHRSEQPVALDADAARLTQVFGNLLNNAAKYSPDGAQISVSVQFEEDSTVSVTVRDPGIGIAPDMLEKVFDLFTQAPGAAVRAPGGLGIGLSLARRLVELHGGTITVASAGVGEGAEFTVRLPARVSERHDHSLPMEAMGSTSAACRRVLVADDNIDGAEMLAAMLMAAGCEVRTVHTGEAALEEADRFRPDIALLDIGMPDVSGLDVGRRLRAQPWGANLVLVAVTGWGQEDDRQRSFEAGFDRHLVKPVDPNTLLELVRDLQSRSR